MHAKPHFVRCLRPNAHDSLAEFDRSLVAAQVRSLQVSETVQLMSGGFPHRMRFKAFGARYRLLAGRDRRLFRSDEKAVDDCETILDCYSRAIKEAGGGGGGSGGGGNVLPRNTAWAHGRKHIFLSEGARQLLERMREERRHAAARVAQRAWRRWRRGRGAGGGGQQPKQQALQRGTAVKPQLQQQQQQQQQLRSSQRPRPQPIMGTPPPMLAPQDGHQAHHLMQVDRCDFKTIQQTCALFGLDLVRSSIPEPS